MIYIIIFSAYGKVFLVRKIRGPDRGNLYAMKVCKTQLKNFVKFEPKSASKSFNKDIAKTKDNSEFLSPGFEKSKHCSEEEDH